MGSGKQKEEIKEVKKGNPQEMIMLSEPEDGSVEFWKSILKDCELQDLDVYLFLF